jgi:demethylmenaquinone methyltransferase/2-methoxy-6-polyprenyl-1,4-benzoquinol methylase
MREYYERRAPEYDDWWLGTGRFTGRERPGWHEEVADLVAALGALTPARTLDVACGTGFLSRHLPGAVTGLDQSAAMLAIARERIPGAAVVRGDGLALPFADGTFDRVSAGHFYGHLEADDRVRFLAEARRVAPELLVIDSARRDDVPAERMDPRVLADGSRHVVFKRWLEPQQLVDELDGGQVVHAGDWFVAVLTERRA